ncbi:peptidase S41 [Deinococcus phoenicis]|uniref:Peptidase S41 n=1 Tax=Deinococcus phoenicis TaxID=1476583 RepID=A0A016QVH6_9DEIO|nr:S41 family peptidase [Deinococcus phoenicis]EYB69809.1 peptidase S41 [Deinococcus phoenicis]
MPTRRALALALALFAALPVGASPATDLFEAATRAVQSEYYGWSTVDRVGLGVKYASVLADKCAPQGDACDYATGRAVLGDLLSELGDAHTNIRDAEGAERLAEVTQNRAVNRTGARVVRAAGGLLVVSVMPGSPAAGAGVRRFDLLTGVNGEAAGKDTGGKNLPVGPNEFIRLERAGAPLRVTLRRAGSPDREVTLPTARLQARDEPTLSWAGPDGKTAVIDYPTFLASDSAGLFLRRLGEAQAAGARALVVDLRYNGGGSLNQCIAAASSFAPVLYRTRGQGWNYTYAGLRGEEVFAFLARAARPDWGLWRGPLAVLVGQDTASCAEVFTYYAHKAGAVVVGEKTRGVGNSGVIFEAMPDGGVLSVTVLRAYTDAGDPLPAFQTPDVAAPTDIAVLTAEGRDTTLEAALSALASPAPDLQKEAGQTDAGRVQDASLNVGRR